MGAQIWEVRPCLREVRRKVTYALVVVAHLPLIRDARFKSALYSEGAVMKVEELRWRRRKGYF